jgi:hypothetical protein
MIMTVTSTVTVTGRRHGHESGSGLGDSPACLERRAVALPGCRAPPPPLHSESVAAARPGRQRLPGGPGPGRAVAIQ